MFRVRLRLWLVLESLVGSWLKLATMLQLELKSRTAKRPVVVFACAEDLHQFAEFTPV